MGKEWDRLWKKDIPDPLDKPHDLRGYAYTNFKPQRYEAGLKAQLWHQQWAIQALRVLKPGGYLLAFGGTRTYHRLVCGLEDAGSEIRDTICWLYGSGFPKSLDISKQIDKMAGAEQKVIATERTPWKVDGKAKIGVSLQGSITGDFCKQQDDNGYRVKYITAPATEAAKEWQGWGTALKPAFEPICVARKPLSEKNVASNVLKWGTGGMDIDGARIGTDIIPSQERGKAQVTNFMSGGFTPEHQGRWPANVILDEEAARMLDGQSGDCRSAINKKATRGGLIFGKGEGLIQFPDGAPYRGETGGASRFFYVAKASRSERGKGNIHPTCKPTTLMEYLIKLVSRQGATILDPFAGSMSTVLAAVALGRKCVAIEQTEEYCEMLKNRHRQQVMDLGT